MRSTHAAGYTKSVTLKQLRIFERVAAHASHSKAAADLHLTQPAVSLQVKELEAMLGGALFEARGRGIVLTEFGQAALAHARSVLASAHDFEETVRGFGELVDGRHDDVPEEAFRFVGTLDQALGNTAA